MRYENVLSADTRPVERTRTDQITLTSANGANEVRTRGLRAKDRVMPILRTGENFETISLINFVGIDESSWNEPAEVPPAPFTDLAVSIPVERPVARIWWATPDGERIAPQSLLYTVTDGILNFTVPRLDHWSMIVVEYTNVP